LSCGEAVGGSRCDGGEETVFGGAIGARDDRDDHVFVNDCGASAGTALADAIEIRVVVLARSVTSPPKISMGASKEPAVVMRKFSIKESAGVISLFDIAMVRNYE
jgi:hypothetical protein